MHCGALSSVRLLTKSIYQFLLSFICYSYSNLNSFRYVVSPNSHSKCPNSNFRDHYAHNSDLAERARILTKSISRFCFVTFLCSYSNRNTFRYVASLNPNSTRSKSNYRDHYARSQTIATIPRLTRTCSKETQG